MKKGFTLIEVMIAMVVLAIALVSLLVTLSGSMSLNEATREEVIAQNAMLEVIARVKEELDLTWGPTIAKYRTTSGRYFPVKDLVPYGTNPEVAWVEVQLNEDLSGYYGAEENAKLKIEWGIGSPHRVDLNADGVATSDFSAVPDAELSALRMVPIVVKLEWQSSSGDRRNTSKKGFLYRHILITKQLGTGGD